MPADKAEKGDKLTGLNHTLTSVENDLLRKRVNRSDGRYFKLLRHLGNEGGAEAPPEDPAPSGGEGTGE